MYLYLLYYITGRGDADTEAEAGARLTCHLLLRLFKTVECPQPALYSVGQLSQWFISVVVEIGRKALTLSFDCGEHLAHKCV